MFHLELVTGLCMGEITALRWRAFDITNKTISAHFPVWVRAAGIVGVGLFSLAGEWSYFALLETIRGIAGSAFEQRAYLAQERVHLLRAAADIGLWPQQNGEVFCMHGKSRLCRQLLQKVAGRAFLHPCRGRVGTAADHLMQLLTVSAAFDGLHQQIFRGDEGEVFPNGLADDRLIYNKSVGHILAETQDRIGAEESLRHGDAAVGGVIQRALQPLYGRRHGGVYLKASGEHKSKLTQHSVKELQGLGITPDIIVLRCDEPFTDPGIFRKISNFCNVKPDCVIENLTLPVLYEAPLYLEQANLSAVVCRELRLSTPEPDLRQWRDMVAAIKSRSRSVTIGLVGKYVQLHDAYLSVAEALHHAGFALGARVDIRWIDSETITEETQEELLSHLDGILVPGGFGSRGIEGMIPAARYAREHHVPYLGICLGMQIAVIEFARHVLGIADADSGEFAPECRHKVIDFMPGQGENIDRGGTLRLGSYPCVIADGTTMARCCGSKEIRERHRHRYEFNNDYREPMQTAGLTISGLSPDGRLVEAVELCDSPFYVGVQYHPEFKSRPNRPHPLFQGFLDAALKGEK